MGVAWERGARGREIENRKRTNLRSWSTFFLSHRSLNYTFTFGCLHVCGQMWQRWCVVDVKMRAEFEDGCNNAVTTTEHSWVGKSGAAAGVILSCDESCANLWKTVVLVQVYTSYLVSQTLFNILPSAHLDELIFSFLGRIWKEIFATLETIYYNFLLYLNEKV